MIFRLELYKCICFRVVVVIFHIHLEEVRWYFCHFDSMEFSDTNVWHEYGYLLFIRFESEVMVLVIYPMNQHPTIPILFFNKVLIWFYFSRTQLRWNYLKSLVIIKGGYYHYVPSLGIWNVMLVIDYSLLFLTSSRLLSYVTLIIFTLFFYESFVKCT